jgi:hypothetical protein
MASASASSPSAATVAADYVSDSEESDAEACVRADWVSEAEDDGTVGDGAGGADGNIEADEHDVVATEQGDDSVVEFVPGDHSTICDRLESNLKWKSMMSTIEDAVLRVHHIVLLGTKLLAIEALARLDRDDTNEPPVAFWKSTTVDQAFGACTRGYQSRDHAALHASFVAVRQRLGAVEHDRTGLIHLLKQESHRYAANAMTSLKRHVAARVAKLVKLRLRLPDEEQAALSVAERRARKDSIVFACIDAVVPSYDTTRESPVAFHPVVNEVRALLRIDEWAWEEPIPAAATSTVVPKRRDLNEVVEVDTARVVRAMHAVNRELVAGGDKAIALVPLRKDCVPRFIQITQDALSDLNLFGDGCDGEDTNGTIKKNVCLEWERKKARKEVERPSRFDDRLAAITSELNAICDKLASRRKLMKGETRESLATRRDELTKERKRLQAERRAELYPASVAYEQRIQKRKREKDELEQAKRARGLAIRAKERPGLTKEEKKTEADAARARKRAREEEDAPLKAARDAEAAPLKQLSQHFKSSAFKKLLELPRRLRESEGRRFADSVQTDGFSVRLLTHKNKKKTSDTPPTSSHPQPPTDCPAKKRVKTTPAKPPTLPESGLLGVDALAESFGTASHGLVEGALRELSPREQNDRCNQLLEEAWTGVGLPPLFLGCDPGKSELVVGVDADLFGLTPAERNALGGAARMTLRYTAANREHDSKPGRYGLRRKQRERAEAAAGGDRRFSRRLKHTSMANEYRSTLKTPEHVLQAERSCAGVDSNGVTLCSKGPGSANVEAWAVARLAAEPIMLGHYERMVHRRLRWKSHVERERSLAKFVQRLKDLEASSGRKLVLAYGGWGRSAGRPGQVCNKKHRPCMGVGLLNKLAVHFLVVIVPEALTTKTCFRCGSDMERHVAHEEARRPARDARVASRLVKALAKAGDDVEKQTLAQQRHDRCIAYRPHIRGLRCCSNANCGAIANRDRNGAANICLQGKRLALGIGIFKVPTRRQQQLQRQQLQEDGNQ